MKNTISKVIKKEIKEKREILKTLSSEVKPLVEIGEYANINEAIVYEKYTTGQHQEFKTFRQWKMEGKTIKKGEKGFYVWGQPVQIANMNPDSEEDEFKYFPLAYIFSNAQVAELKNYQSAQAAAQVQEQIAKYIKAAEVKILYVDPVPAKERPQIQTSADAYEVLLNHWEGIDHHEKIYVMLMSRSNRVLGVNLVSQGGVTGTIADVKLIFQPAIKANACSIIIAHNHPSGNLKPSESDVKLTKKIISAGEHLDIKVLDHVIATREGYYSFADEGLMCR